MQKMKFPFYCCLLMLIILPSFCYGQGGGKDGLKDCFENVNRKLDEIENHNDKNRCPPSRPTSPLPNIFLSGRFVQASEKFQRGDIIFNNAGGMDISTHVMVVERLIDCLDKNKKKVSCVCAIDMTSIGVSRGNEAKKESCVAYEISSFTNSSKVFRLDNDEIANDMTNSFGNMIAQDVKYSVGRAVELYGKKFFSQKAGEEQKRRLLKNAFKEYTLKNLSDEKKSILTPDEKKVFTYSSRVAGKEKKEICSTSASNRLWSIGLKQNIPESPELERDLMNTVVGKFQKDSAPNPNLANELDKTFEALADKVLKNKEQRRKLKIDSYPFDIDSNRMLPNQFYEVLKKNAHN